MILRNITSQLGVLSKCRRHECNDEWYFSVQRNRDRTYPTFFL